MPETKNCTSVWLKVESVNPTGSFEDHMAISVIGNALARGELKSDQTVIEYMGGSTGSALAFACASAGIKFLAVFSDAFSKVKKQTIEVFGEDVLSITLHCRGVSPELVQEMKALCSDELI